MNYNDKNYIIIGGVIVLCASKSTFNVGSNACKTKVLVNLADRYFIISRLFYR